MNLTYLWFYLALFFELLATYGFIVFLIKQEKWIFRASYWVLFAGFIFHSILLGYKYYLLGAVPVLNFKASLSFFSWSIICAYLILQLRFRLMVLGSFIAPFAAFLMVISSTMPWVEGTVRPEFKSLWLTVHIGTAFMGNGLFVILFVVSIMYLILEYYIKNKNFGALYNRLPSLATLDNIGYYSLIYGFTFLTAGMITGSVYAQLSMGSYWQWDPREVWSLITWFFYAVLIHERLTIGWRGRKAAMMAILCFFLLLFAFLGSRYWLGGYHSFDKFGE